MPERGRSSTRNRGRTKSPGPQKRTKSPAASPAPASSPKLAPKVAPAPRAFFLDPDRIPFWLYIPNLVGYLRWWTLILAMNPGGEWPLGLGGVDRFSQSAIWCLAISLALDFIDGPLARRYDMCTVFGDLLDHVADHVTMYYLVRLTAEPLPWVPGVDAVSQLPGAMSTLFAFVAAGNIRSALSLINHAVSAVHVVVALGYMAVYQHYFKHSKKGNFVTRNIEANNYWNLPATLYAANTFLLPILKMSYVAEHNLSPLASTWLLDSWDYVGMIITASYTVAVCVDSSMWPSEWWYPVDPDENWDASTGVLRGTSERVRDRYVRVKRYTKDRYNTARDHARGAWLKWFS